MGSAEMLERIAHSLAILFSADEISVAKIPNGAGSGSNRSFGVQQLGLVLRWIRVIHISVVRANVAMPQVS